MSQLAINLVIINGWAASGHWWQNFVRGLTKHLEKEGVAVASSRTIDLDRSLTVEQWMSYLDDRIPENSVLLGWSLGGALATLYAAHNPQKIHALACLQSNPCFVQQPDWQSAMPRRQYQAFERLLQTMSAADFFRRFGFMQAQGSNRQKPEFRRLLQLGFSGLPDQSVLMQTLSLLQQLDVREALRQVVIDNQTPCRLILGDGDMLVPVSVARGLSNLVGDEQLKVITGMGHLPMLDFSETVITEIGSFLSACLVSDLSVGSTVSQSLTQEPTA